MHVETYQRLRAQCAQKRVTLVIVSKTRTAEQIGRLYALGQRDFAENYVRELCEKHALLPTDIRWHLIGHLQRNKVKQVVGFVHCIQSVDSIELLDSIQKHARAHGRVVDVLLQVHVAQEENKFGFLPAQMPHFLQFIADHAHQYTHLRICGLMGMATFTQDQAVWRREFTLLREVFTQARDTYFAANESFRVLSMGMSADYETAIEQGSTLVRVGSLVFDAHPFTN